MFVIKNNQFICPEKYTKIFKNTFLFYYPGLGLILLFLSFLPDPVLELQRLQNLNCKLMVYQLFLFPLPLHFLPVSPF